MNAQGPRIAIVGIGCRLPGAAGLDAVWERLSSGRAPFERVPLTRFDPVALGAEVPGPFVPRAALLEDVPLDWRALRIPPLQVERLHQCEKLALQTMAEAIADAGLRPGAAPVERGQIRIAATTLGPDPRIDPMRRIRRHRLATPLGEALARLAPTRRETALAILDRVVDLASPPVEPDSFFTSASIVAGRASNLYDFRGGHAAIDVGTASSLAAVAESVEALARGECDLAVVCAVAPLVTPSALLALAHRGELARGELLPFDPAATGTLLGEGAAALVLKREEDVRGERVYAIVEGIAGAAEPGAKDPGALERCVARAAREALGRAGAASETVAAIASRAAGLPADGAEVVGLADTYGGRREPAPVTSCVPATGFLQGATGMIAMVQAALAVHRGSWPGPHGTGAAPASAGIGRAAPCPALDGPRRVAVSDAGPEAVAYHAVLSAPTPRDVARRVVRPVRRPDAEGLAVVGVGLVVPGANDVDTYWKNVLDHVDPVRDLPRSRFDVDTLVGKNTELAHAFRTRLAAIVSPPPFDPGQYGIGAEEAASLDPAVPIALHASDQALRDARWNPATGRRGVAIFGQLSLRAREAAVETRIAFGNTLALAEEAMREAGLDETLLREAVQAARALFDARGPARWPAAPEASTGYALTSRVAAAFGLSGVPLTVDAACASSLAAVQTASEALARGEVDVALAGGVAYNLLPEYYVGLGLLGALSPRGGLPFHLDAEGFIPAEGAGAVVLKRLEDARADGDRVYAIVRGHGVSSDGRGLSIYSPSTIGQQLSIRRALEVSGIAPETVDLIEAHGPGTRLGDRTEVASYAAVYGGLQRSMPLVLSASKSQVGHTTSASGIVAMVRAVLALHKRVLPPSNVSRERDPDLHLEAIPAVLGTEARPWIAPPAGHPRRAAVSAFGMAGVNHHVLLEEAPGAAAGSTPITAPPAAGLDADRFVIDLAPLALPERPARISLQGRRAILLGSPAGPARALASALRARGASATVATPGHLDDAFTASPDADLFVDLSAFGPARGLLDAEAAAIAARAREGAGLAFDLLRRAYDRLAASTPERPAVYVAVTSLGGDLGLSGSGAGNVLGAFHLGLARALKQETPHALVKAMDFAPLARPEDVAKALLAEIEDGNERVQVGIAGRRFVPNLRREALPAEGRPRRSVDRGDVFLFSGGGRGVVFECACAVARLGAVAVVTGRTPLPDPALPHLAMDDEKFAEFRRREIVPRRRERGFTPVRFAREMDALGRERELHRNLARAGAEGLDLEYEVCDVTDAASVRSLVERVRARHGGISFIGHGAMVERSASVPGKTADDVARTLDAKVAGLLHLLDATQEDPLRAVIAFGSGVARFGNRGQTDYAGANALMAALLPVLAARRTRPFHCVTVDWPAWREIGWAASNPDIEKGLDALGVTSISPEEGRHWFLSELHHGTSPEVLLVSERMLHAWPFFGTNADGSRPATLTDDRGAPLVAGAFPLLDVVVEHDPGRLVACCRLDADRDRFLAQHRVDGRPVLPGAFALEMLAEAAALARPGEVVVEATAFRIDAPVALPRRHVDLRVEATTAPGRDGLLDAHLIGRLPIAAPTGRDRLHASGTFRFAPAMPELAPIAVPERDGVVRARSFYRLSRDPVELGPLFCRARWVEIRGGEGRATIEPFDPRLAVPGKGATAWPAFQIDPLLLDSAFQIAGSVEGYAEGWVCVPIAIDRLVVGRRPREGERARVRANRVAEESPRVFYDLLVVGEDDAVLFEIFRLELRRVAAAEIAA